MASKSYSELIRLSTFEERYDYLRLRGGVGVDTFGFDRYLNQFVYQKSSEWKEARNKAIIRDMAGTNSVCDLGISDRPIVGRVYVHHIVPITKDDVLEWRPILFDLDNLICCSNATHNAIHYGDGSKLAPTEPTERKPNDTCPWKG